MGDIKFCVFYKFCFYI